MRSTISSRLVPSLFGPIWAAAIFIWRTSIPIPRTSRGIAIHLLILMRARGCGWPTAVRHSTPVPPDPTYTDVNVHQSALPGEAPVASALVPPRVREASRGGLPLFDSRDSPDLRLPVRGPP